MKKKPRRRSQPITKQRFLKALEGSGGIKSRIAERLECHPSAVRHALSQPDWDDVRERYFEECESVKDAAEKAIKNAIESDDPQLATQNARWYLARKARERGFGDESKLVMEGGDKPIKMNNAISLDELNLPIEIRRKLLETIEQQEQDEETNDPQGDRQQASP